jgi:hypothetical protein
MGLCASCIAPLSSLILSKSIFSNSGSNSDDDDCGDNGFDIKTKTYTLAEAKKSHAFDIEDLKCILSLDEDEINRDI